MHLNVSSGEFPSSFIALYIKKEKPSEIFTKIPCFFLSLISWKLLNVFSIYRLLGIYHNKICLTITWWLWVGFFLGLLGFIRIIILFVCAGFVCSDAML